MVQVLIDASIFSFFLLISFFINDKYVSLSKLHFAQMHGKFKFRFYLTPDITLFFTKEYSEKIIYYIYDIFWMLIHIKNVTFYLHFFFIYLLKVFLYYLIFFFYYFF